MASIGRCLLILACATAPQRGKERFCGWLQAVAAARTPFGARALSRATKICELVGNLHVSPGAVDASISHACANGTASAAAPREDKSMRDRHGMALVRRPSDNATIAPHQRLTQLSRTAALITSRMDDVCTAPGAEPATWTRAQLEDVIAALDGVADIASCEADRLRRYQDSMSSTARSQPAEDPATFAV